MLLVILTATAAVGGTVAYLTSQDSQVNVMTMGNVKIQQIEQERDENGALQSFTQSKPAFPAVGEIKWDENGVDVNGTSYKVFDENLKNVVDKIVTVKNTGTSSAYVRTIIVVEAPDFDPDGMIHVNINGDGLHYSNWEELTLNGEAYVYMVFTYDAALAPGAATTPSLMQVFLDSKADNAYVESFGNTWEIYAISQAVQTEGFASADVALDTAFGPVASGIANWCNGLGDLLLDAEDVFDSTGKSGVFTLGANLY